MLGVHFAITAEQERTLLAADFAYTWQNFLDVRAFYGRAAEAGRAVIFTAT